MTELGLPTAGGHPLNAYKNLLGTRDVSSWSVSYLGIHMKLRVQVSNLSQIPHEMEFPLTLQLQLHLV